MSISTREEHGAGALKLLVFAVVFIGCLAGLQCYRARNTETNNIRAEKVNTCCDKTASTGVRPNLFKNAKGVKLQQGDGAVEWFPDAQQALAVAKEHDTVVLEAGMHHGPLIFKSSHVTLVGKPGALVSSNRSWLPQWRQEPDVAPFAFSSPVPFQPCTVQIDGRVLIDIRERRARKSLKELHAYGTGRGARELLGGMFTYLAQQKRLLVSVPGVTTPAQMSGRRVEIAALESSGVLIDGYDGCEVRGLIVTGGRYGVRIRNSAGSVVSRCLVLGTDIGVCLDRGARECRVLSCDFTWGSDGLVDPGAAGSDLWYAHKHYGTCDKWAVFARMAGDNNEVAYNYIYNHWDGIQNDNGVDRSGVKEHFLNKVFRGIAEYNIGLKVHHNRLDLLVDDGLEPGGELVRNQWYSNHVTRARCSARLKTVTVGPFFFFDNLLRDCNDTLRFYKSTPKQALVYIYHNLVKHSTAISYHGMDDVCWGDPWLRKKLKRGAPGFHVYNNIFISDRPLGNRSKVTPNHKADYNLYTCSPDPELTALGLDLHGIFNARPAFVDPGHDDWRLRPASAGKEAGVDLGRLDVRLPFCKGKYFPGRAPDMGLLQIDRQKIPRGPVSGLWKLAVGQLPLTHKKFDVAAIRPIRWILAKECDVVIDAGGNAGMMKFAFMRIPNGANSVCSITDTTGSILAVGGKTGGLQFVRGNVCMPADSLVSMRLRSSGVNRWRLVEPVCARLGIDARQGIRLLKYDNAPFVFTYHQAAGQDVFSLWSSATAIKIIDQDGRTLRPAHDGLVHAGVPGGVYRIILWFRKKADIRIAGNNTVIYIAGKQRE